MRNLLNIMLPLMYNAVAQGTHLLPFKDSYHMHCLATIFIFGLRIFLLNINSYLRSVPFQEGQTECTNAYKTQMWASLRETREADS